MDFRVRKVKQSRKESIFWPRKEKKEKKAKSLNIIIIVVATLLKGQMFVCMSACAFVCSLTKMRRRSKLKDS